MTDATATAFRAAWDAMAKYHLAAEMRRLHGELLSPEEAASVALKATNASREADRADAERWRWLVKRYEDGRSDELMLDPVLLMVEFGRDTSEIRALIDAAMAKDPQP
jgi:hypothetical protein